MDVTPLLGTHQKIVQSYAAGRFRMNGTIFETDVLVWGETALPWPEPPASQRRSQGEEEWLEALISSLERLEFPRGEVDILLVGVGARSVLVSPSLRQRLTGICRSVEIMDTGAACRTFNVLTAEGRKVGAALLRI